MLKWLNCSGFNLNIYLSLNLEKNLIESTSYKLKTFIGVRAWASKQLNQKPEVKINIDNFVCFIAVMLLFFLFLGLCW